jgi:hypothetical protein
LRRPNSAAASATGLTYCVWCNHFDFVFQLFSSTPFPVSRYVYIYIYNALNSRQTSVRTSMYTWTTGNHRLQKHPSISSRQDQSRKPFSRHSRLANSKSFQSTRGRRRREDNKQEPPPPNPTRSAIITHTHIAPKCLCVSRWIKTHKRERKASTAGVKGDKETQHWHSKVFESSHPPTHTRKRKREKNSSTSGFFFRRSLRVGRHVLHRRLPSAFRYSRHLYFKCPLFKLPLPTTTNARWVNICSPSRNFFWLTRRFAFRADFFASRLKSIDQSRIDSGDKQTRRQFVPTPVHCRDSLYYILEQRNTQSHLLSST